MGNKYPGIDNINKPAFDAIVPKTKEAIESGEIPIPAGGTKLYYHFVSIRLKAGQSVASGCVEEFTFEYISKYEGGIGGPQPWSMVINNLNINALSLFVNSGRIVRFYATSSTPMGAQLKLIVQSTVSSSETEYLIDLKGKYDVTDSADPI